MKVKQTIKRTCLILGIVISLGLSTTLPVLAADQNCSDAGYKAANPSKCCGDINVSIIGGGVCNNINNTSGNTQDNGVWKILIFILNIMTAGVGILGVAGIVYCSVLYTTASDKAEQTKKAIGIITNVVIGIVAYGLMYIGLNFLIPGGIFT